MFSVNADKLPAPLRGAQVAQIALIVPNLESAIELWSGLIGEDDWLVYTYSPENVHNLEFRHQPGKFSMRLALAGSSPQIELIEPVDGPSIYHEWRDEKGFGLHHLGFFVPSIEDGMRDMADAGVELIQAGSGYGLDGDGGFAYYDTLDTVGAITELIEVPKRRRPSESVNRLSAVKD